MPAPHRSDLARRLKGLNLYLVGMMGAGKSAVGPPLAQALGYRFIDADTTLAETAGRPIPDIFAEAGEEGFRALESAVLNELARWHSLVVARCGDLAGCSRSHSLAAAWGGSHPPAPPGGS
jgi:shikimate kinase